MTAALFLVLVVAQTLTGYDFTPAYEMLGRVSAVELALTAIIKRQEKSNRKKDEEND